MRQQVVNGEGKTRNMGLQRACPGVLAAALPVFETHRRTSARERPHAPGIQCAFERSRRTEPLLHGADRVLEGRDHELRGVRQLRVRDARQRVRGRRAEQRGRRHGGGRGVGRADRRLFGGHGLRRDDRHWCGGRVGLVCLRFCSVFGAIDELGTL
eukprot:6172454-Pleurochrysis_carterae.AAC.2